METLLWSDWLPFPNPSQNDLLTAPFGKGAYQLRNKHTGNLILFGIGKNCAYRMSSLLPKPYGQGTRNNSAKRDYLLENIESIEYRTVGFLDDVKLKEFERQLKSQKVHVFNT